MKYYNAQNLLPEPLLREVQSYVQGGYIYVPSPLQPRRAWGEVSGSRRSLTGATARSSRATAPARASTPWRRAITSRSTP